MNNLLERLSMVIKQGQVVTYKNNKYVVMLVWGKNVRLAPILGDNHFDVEEHDIQSIIREAPAPQTAEEKARAAALK